MLRGIPSNSTSLKVNKSYVADSLEVKLRKVLQTKEPIEQTSAVIYTERKDGVQAQYDIRTDRFEIAIEAMDRVSKSSRAKRDGFSKPLEEVTEPGKGEVKVSEKSES